MHKLTLVICLLLNPLFITSPLLHHRCALLECTTFKNLFLKWTSVNCVNLPFEGGSISSLNYGKSMSVQVA